jgi:hypothetical protein
MKHLLASIMILSTAYGAEDKSSEQPVPASIREIVAIQIPKIRTQDTTLSELVHFLAQRITELDPNKPGSISFFTSGFTNTKNEENGRDAKIIDEKKVSYAATDVRVDKVMMDLAKLFDVEFHVTNVGVVITPSGGMPFPNSKSEKGEIYYTYK